MWRIKITEVEFIKDGQTKKKNIMEPFFYDVNGSPTYKQYQYEKGDMCIFNKYNIKEYVTIIKPFPLNAVKPEYILFGTLSGNI